MSPFVPNDRDHKQFVAIPIFDRAKRREKIFEFPNLKETPPEVFGQ